MKKKSHGTERTADGKTSTEDRLPERAGGAATAGVGVARKVAHLTPGERVARGRLRVTRFPGPARAGRSRPSTDPTLLRCSRSRRKPGARAGADPVRPDAGLPVHLLPRCGADHGGRSGAPPHSGLMVQLCGDAHL